MSPGGGSDGRRVAAALLGVFLSLLPQLIVVAALPSIAHSLHSSRATLGWALTAPMLASAVLLPTAGKLGDVFGHRRLFLVGLTVSGLFALLTGLATSAGALIAFRTVSQAAGTATGPSAIALVISDRSGPDRQRVLGFWASSTALAPTVGLLLGGPAVEALSWRGLFLGQAAIGLLIVPYAALVLQETVRQPRVRFDVAGAAAFMVASGGVVFALDRSSLWGWRHPAVWVSFAVAAAGMAAFVVAEHRVAEPILAPYLLRHPSYTASVSCEFLIQVATNGALFVAPLLFAGHYGASVARSSWYLAPMPLGMALTAPFGGRLARMVDERAAAVGGSLLLAAAIGAMTAADSRRWLFALLAAWFLTGVANGVIRPAIAAAAAGALGPGSYGAGMAATRMVSTVGAAAGISLAISLLTTTTETTTVAVCAGAAVLAAAGSIRITSRSVRAAEVVVYS